MKKTLTILFTMTGVALGEANLVQLWTVDFQATAPIVTTSTDVTMSYVPTSSTTNGYVANSSSYFSMTQSTGALTYRDAFVYEVELYAPTLSSTSTNWPVFAGVGADNTINWKAAYYKAADKNFFVLDIANTAHFTDKGGTVSTSSNSEGKLKLTDVTTPITLSFRNDGKGTMSLFVDNDLAGSVSFTGDQVMDTVVNRFCYGFPLGNAGRDNCEVRILNAGMYKVIPEPTTATLSLLALAGLAARRRRK